MNDLAERLVKEAIAKGVIIATAESCTGGLVSGAITSVAGSSAMFDRGFVTYSNDAKAELLGISPDLIKRYGAVSTEVAIAMAEGALTHSKATLSVAITGIAGPGGGNIQKPVGLVHFATAVKGQDTRAFEKRLGSISRDAIRHGAVHAALQALLSRLP